ncbi:hypothetical protein KCMC57_63780 (plasmid) [Kitasatospora sp. CMC57]|uniref:Uncharacterized protein n=1 Tax=Kitasatospora sp. CMC57 TaxID=3231513 RepID=A0AB33KB33_9ACTN
MHQVTQTILHDDAAGRTGNCLQEAIASALELPLGQVPHFAEHEDWDDRLAAFLRQHDRTVRHRPVGTPCALAIGVGPSARGVLHSVVLVDGAIAWDPHPSRAGLLRLVYILTLDRSP